MPAGFNFVPVLIISVLAFLVPLVLSQFKAIPTVVGEIVVGILIGRSALNWVQYDEPSVLILSELGFAFLMFLSGLEIDFSLISRAGGAATGNQTSPLWLAMANFGITTVLSIPVGFGLVRLGLANDPWMMALILSTTSLGVVMPVLKQRGLSSGRFGQSVVMSALLADFITMLLITVYVSLFSSGLSIEILLMGLLVLAFLFTYRLGARQLRRPAVRRLIESLEVATSQFKVRGSIALMLAFVVLAESVDVELILGAFLAGAQLSLLSTRDDEDLREKLDAIGFGFFIPFFFISVGLGFNLPLLFSNPTAMVLAPLLLAVAVVIKLIAGLAFRWSFSWKETWAAGWLLSARLSLIIAAAAIGLRIGVISEATNAAIIVVAALTSMLAPLISNRFLPDASKSNAGRFFIYGAANLGLQVGQELRKHGESVLFLEADAKLAELVRNEGFEVIVGDPNSVNLLLATQAEAFLVLTGDDDLNYSICKKVHELGVSSIIVHVNNPTRMAEFQQLGVWAITAAMLRPMILAGMARNPDLFSLLTAATDDRDIREIRLRNKAFANRTLSSMVFPGDSLVLTVYRENEVRVPHGSTRLKLGDRLTMLGHVEALDDVERLLEADSL